MPDPSPSLDAIFCEAIELRAADARDAYLADACGSDDALRRQVETLVAAHFRAGIFLERSPAPPGPTAAWTPPDGPGTMIGPYKLLEQIGEGGMGVVYVAEQAEPVRRKVALKVIKPGMDTRQVLARFDAERHALSLMDHPNIARILDGGATDAGRPYFVMELVRGIPITDYCDRACLPTRERLRLFAAVCRAVQHAHQKGVIHRDLKPTNVLVTLYDGTPVPKVIDFGVAKAIGRPLSDGSLYTRFAQLVGTPLYMAPEQAELSGLDVDTRADVYALGVLLYELLTGTTPFDRDTMLKAGLDEVRRIIREDDPPRPSQRLSTLGAEERSGVSGRRGLDERRLSHLLRGDLDWVAMKALEKSRERRYESAGAFAADVERYLADEPVEARPASWWYQFRRFARRNKAALVTVGLVAAALVAGTAVSIWQAVRATDARRQAEAERDRAEAAEARAANEAAAARTVSGFLQVDVIGQARFDVPLGPDAGGESKLTVREALNRAAARIGQRFQNQPLVEAAIRTSIGQAYQGVGASQFAVPHLERAVALRTAQLGPDHPHTAASTQSLATAYSWAGRHAEAIAIRRQILDNRTALLGPEDPETLAAESELAGAYASDGQWNASVQLWEHVLEKRRATPGLRHPDTLDAMRVLALNYDYLDRLPESLALYEEMLRHRQSATGSETPIPDLLYYAYACQRAGQLDRAERLLREALEYNRKRDDSIQRRITAANIRGWLARTLLLRERYDAAEPLAREAVAFFEKEFPGNPRRFYWMSLLGAVLVGQQKHAEAEPLLLQGYEGMKQQEAILNGGERPRLLEVGERIVRYYEATKQPEKARDWRARLTPVKPQGR